MDLKLLARFLKLAAVIVVPGAIPVYIIYRAYAFVKRRMDVRTDRPTVTE